MTRAIIVIFIATLLGGCVVLPLDHRYRDGYGYRYGSDSYGYRYDGDRDWGRDVRGGYERGRRHRR